MKAKKQSEEGIVFGTLSRNGVLKTRILPRSAIDKCPHLILMPEHYRFDGRCRCDDRAHVEMKAWGYKWDQTKNRWN